MQAEAARMEKLRARSEAELKKAEKMRGSEPAPETQDSADAEVKDEAAATEAVYTPDTPDTPTEE